MHSNPVPTIHPVKTIRVVPEPGIDFTQFPHVQTIVSTLTLFLKPLPIPAAFSTLYFYMKARAMKVLEWLIATPECGKYLLESGMIPTLVENALQVMPLDEEPKILRLEWQAALLREKLFESTYKHLQRGDEYGQEEQEEDYEGEDVHEEENGEGSESSGASSEKEDKVEAPVAPLSPLSSGEEEECEDESPVVAGRVRWRDIKLGAPMLVARREKIGSTRSNWVTNMDDAIGRVGIVKLLDKRHHQVLLQFYDADTASSTQWWFCYDILQFPENFTKSSLQIIHEAQLPQLIELDSATEMSLFILYSRQAVLNLINHTPVSSFIALGVKNLALILQLATYEPYQPSIPQERFPLFDNRISPSLRHLETKLATLLRMEEQSMRNNANAAARSNAQLRVDTPPLLRKSGFLYKQNKLFKTWKRFWFVLQGGYLTEYKSVQASNPVGVLDLSADFISAEDVTKKSKIFAKKEFTFQITTNRGNQLLQAANEEDRDDWIVRLKDAAAFAQANARSQIGPNLTDYLTREVIRHFRETSLEGRPTLVEESSHPYTLQTKSKKVMRLDGVESLVVVFDSQCCTTSGMDTLRFFKNPACTELIASFSGKGPSAFPPVVICASQFWITFSTESNTAEWGYKFYVHGLRKKQTDEQMMGKPSFDFAFTVSDWLLGLDPSWAREFYCTGTYDALLYHLDSNPPLHHKIKVLSCLTRLTQRYREFPIEARPDLVKLDKYKKEMFEMYSAEKATGECIHSVELQRLVEWMTQVEIAEQYRRMNLTKEEKDKEREREREKAKERAESAWFHTCVKTTALMKQLIKGENFPRDFIKEACMEDRKHILVEESPHPYPNGVRVTSTVHMPNAQSLIITFDPRSSTEPNCDYLMFSRVAVGGDELGFFTGDFPSQPLVITGDRFIWSFFSDSAETGSDWGFRFTVTPQFSEEITKEMETQCEVDCEYLTNVAPEWTLAMDHELVKFINSVCDKIKKSSFHIRLDNYDFTELLHAHPLLVGLPPAALSLRFALLKHLNAHLSAIIPLVDLRLITEDWSLAFLVCGLRGHVFYETKMELLHDALSRTKFYGRRCVVTLDRRERETLFEQGFKQLNHIDPSRLKHMDKAWEVKLQKEGAQDAGGPYRESITQFCGDIQSKELKLFIPCPNAKEEVGFNQDKFVPNPKATSPHHLAMFEFIGKLIGIAIRTKNCLDLSLPSLLWKPIVCIRTDRTDLEAVDKRCCQYLDAIANNGKNSAKLSPEAFNEYIFETFTTQASDGSLVELKPGGKNISVTWDNRMEFCTLAEQFRLNEFKPQIEAIIRGISSIIPIQLLYLCTWQELELRVVGRAGVDLRLLRKHTRYCGVSPNERHVIMFWKVLETFTPEELTLFIRFVWGRSKLPSPNEFYTAQFQLQSFSRETSHDHSNDPDDFLPEAQTCFFSLALPRYSSPEVMKQKLLYAITTCRDIDADFLVPDQGEDRTHTEADSDVE